FHGSSIALAMGSMTKENPKSPPHYLAYIEERSINDIRKGQESNVAIFNLVRMVSEYNAMLE
ncbi:hypothetical protein, partial [Serratia marcescens]|uniref:hypothetical protein n=1 Tax=Serratia marcescens TaxID=615 RepID=UPI001952A74A